MTTDEENAKLMRRGLRALAYDALVSVRHMLLQEHSARSLGMAVPPDVKETVKQAEAIEQQLKTMFESIKAN